MRIVIGSFVSYVFLKEPQRRCPISPLMAVPLFDQITKAIIGVGIVTIRLQYETTYSCGDFRRLVLSALFLRNGNPEVGVARLLGPAAAVSERLKSFASLHK